MQQVSAEDAQRVLKDLMFSAWRGREEGNAASSGADSSGGEGSGLRAPAGGRAEACREARADTLKMLALVDFYLPFLPLERRHIEKCVVPHCWCMAPSLDWRSAWCPCAPECAGLHASQQTSLLKAAEGWCEERLLGSETLWVVLSRQAVRDAACGEAASVAGGTAASEPDMGCRGDQVPY